MLFREADVEQGSLSVAKMVDTQIERRENLLSFQR